MKKAGFDIIGDVHGCADLLEDLLFKLGYTFDPFRNVFAHKTRTAIFVGDLVDRGAFQLRTLEMVKAMVDAGTAQMVLGNHEFNAIAYATPDPEKPGHFLREHTGKNKKQHRAFLWQLTREQQDYYLAWFRTLPLWLDLGDLRVVHACWHQPSIDRIEKALGGNRFKNFEQIAAAARKSDKPGSLYQAVETILKGPELSLPDYDAPSFLDKDGTLRSEARIRWWKSGTTKLAEMVEVSSGHEMPDRVLRKPDQSFAYNDKIPVIYGHYWRKGSPVEHEDWTQYTACVDFSAVKCGTMVAYRWDGESEINWRHYHPHGTSIVSDSPST